MAIHKLATGPVTLTITRCSQVEGNFGPQTVFDGDNDTSVFVSEMTAMRQLARLGLTPETVVGATLRFEQIKKDGKTFTNIDFASGEPGAAPAPRASASAAPAYTPAPKMSVAELGGIYAECVSQAMVTLGAKCEEAGIPIDAAAIQAAAATLFIKATR